MQVGSVTPNVQASNGQGTNVSQTAQNAFGLEFQSLLRIILTQLTYQDPLKPLDNTEFVSQLAQFSQLQQSQNLNDQVTSLLTAQSATQATSLLGRTVDVNVGGNLLSGTVKSVSFTTGSPTITLETPGGQTISSLSIANVAQIRE
ncbi:flagellar hook assembly protein FlgD [Sphingorhabdus arenilitoris]|uniref:Basal-body rod modification protein FlgD n=1 Tax=Sphingorhabdus arenilitoris TaxID=1490041 RepID=A0ABV8RCH3_9SPHN